MVTPKNLASLTSLIHFCPMTTGGNSELSWRETDAEFFAFFRVQLQSVLSRPVNYLVCSNLSLALLPTSDVVVSSTNILREAFLIVRSLIIIKKSHGPSLVPCGTPEGTESHSETHPSQSLILCEWSDKKSIIQLMTLGAMSSTLNLLIKILWSIRSNAFL